jgi:hypothetical protein
MPVSRCCWPVLEAAAQDLIVMIGIGQGVDAVLLRAKPACARRACIGRCAP